MRFSFKFKIYKAGINPCVKVPARITKMMTATKGYIPVKGSIAGFAFEQTLCPVKNDLYRLYVNGLMLKGSNTKVGDTVVFTLEQAAKSKDSNLPMPPLLQIKLKEHKLAAAFKALAPFRQKEILRYLNHIKTEATLQKNIDKLMLVLQGKASSPLLRKK